MSRSRKKHLRLLSRSDRTLMPQKINGVCKRKESRETGKNTILLSINRGAKIQNEVITSHKKNVEIEWIWNDLEEKEDCEELAKVITAKLCKTVVGYRTAKGCLQRGHQAEGRPNPPVHGVAQE